MKPLPLTRQPHRTGSAEALLVRTIQLDLLFTILAALVVLSAGRALVARSAFLKRFSIPAPVVGGVLVAILLALADGFGGVRSRST